MRFWVHDESGKVFRKFWTRWEAAKFLQPGWVLVEKAKYRDAKPTVETHGEALL